MRCARCDKPAVPQAVGRTAEGLLVFGWCVACLDEEGCRDVEVASRCRKPSLILDLRPARATRRGNRRRVARPAVSRRAGWGEERVRALRFVALALAAWGIALAVTGGGLAAAPGASRGGPLGRGSPVLMVIGGGATVLVAGALWRLGRSPAAALTSPSRWLRGVRTGAFLAAIVILLIGIVTHDPRRDVLVIALTTLAMAVSVAAWWWEGRPSGRTAG